VSLVLRHGIKLLSLGLAIGLCTSLLLARFVSSLLYSVSSTDPLTLGLAMLVLLLTGFLARLSPALRATRINPITTVRE
jgi:ABC-type antimicrobial peptide transport system permease subunit